MLLLQIGGIMKLSRSEKIWHTIQLAICLLYLSSATAVSAQTPSAVVDAEATFWRRNASELGVPEDAIVKAFSFSKRSLIISENRVFWFNGQRYSILNGAGASKDDAIVYAEGNEGEFVWVQVGKQLYRASREIDTQSLPSVPLPKAATIAIASENGGVLLQLDGGQLVHVSKNLSLQHLSGIALAQGEEIVRAINGGALRELMLVTTRRVLKIGESNSAELFDVSKRGVVIGEIKNVVVDTRGEVFLEVEGHPGIFHSAGTQFVERTLNDAIVGIFKTSDGIVWVPTMADGVLAFSQGVEHLYDRSTGHLASNEISEAKVGLRGRSLFVVVPEQGIVQLNGNGQTRAFSAEPHVAIPATARLDRVFSNDRALVIEANGGVRILQDGFASRALMLPGVMISASATQDGSIWVASPSTLHRLVKGRWHDIHVPGISFSLARQVVDVDGLRHLIVTHDSGNFVLGPRHGALVLKSVDPNIRTMELSLKLDGDMVDDPAFLRYRLDRAYPTNRAWTEREFSGNTSVAAPPEIGASIYLEASAIDALGYEHVLSGHRPDKAIDMPLISRKPDKISMAKQAAALGLPLIVAHCIAWLGFLWVYPYSKHVQAGFVWSPHLRKLAGLWYTDALLYFLPTLQLRLLYPFRAGLIADARIESLDHYYLNVKLADSSGITYLLPENFRRGALKQLLIRGASGAGKTQLVRYLISERKRIAVFVSAVSCGDGVVKAILRTLPPEAQGLSIIERLIYQGQIDVYIDGLNEAAADARSEVRAFLLANPHANVLLTTQPFRWPIPANVTSYEMLPLEADQIRNYLFEVGPPDGAYAQRVDTYLAGGSGHLITGNPYDLTILSRMLDAGVVPSEFDLQEEYFLFLGKIFTERSGNNWPLAKLAALAYDSKKCGSRTLEIGNDDSSLAQFLLEEKVIVRAAIGDGTKLFRHDKLQDYLVAYYLLRFPPLQLQYLSDIRFAGVYMLLAGKLSHEDAQFLLSQLALSATQERESSLLYGFVDRLRELGRLAAGERS
jgi:hypothetical protein